MEPICAEHYRDNPTVLGYDLLNEPIPQYPALQKYNSQLEPLYKKLTAAIRTVDTNHLIILGGAQWDSNFAVFGAPFDSNLMYTFHKYWPRRPKRSSSPILISATATTFLSGSVSQARIPIPGFMILCRYWKKTRLAGHSGPTRRWTPHPPS